MLFCPVTCISSGQPFFISLAINIPTTMKSKLSYQQARQMCTSRGLANTGTVSLLRKRLADWEKKKREDSKPPRHPFQEARAEAIVYESFHPTATDVVKQGKEALMAELRAGEFTTSHVDEEPLFIANHKGHTLFERMEGLQNEVKTLGSKVQGLEGNAAKVDAELRDVRLELNDKVELLRSGRDRVGNAVRIRYLLNTTKFIGDGLLPSKQYDLVKHGDEEAHMADPITDAKMFRDGVCHHDSAFTQVYGLSWSQVLVYGMLFGLSKLPKLMLYRE